MKQLLSGNDWLVSHFLPGETGAYTGIIRRIAQGELYGGEFIPAVVPGDVQSDALDAGLIEDINYGFNARKAEWTYQRDWLYVKRFLPVVSDHQRIQLCFDGVDYACEVYLNGIWLGNHENAWEPFSFDITDRLLQGMENSLIVLVKAAPEAECQWGFTSKVRNLKARFAYGWDWCTRLVPLGIWKDVYLQYEQAMAIDDLHLLPEVDYISHSATLEIELTIRTNSQTDDTCASFQLIHPDGKCDSTLVPVKDHIVRAQFHISNVSLWYPNGMGEQPLYTVTATLGDALDSRKLRIGLRHIEWRRTQGAPENALPYQPFINGRRVYLQGYNYTPLRQLYGRVHSKVYQKRIELVKRVGANYLRVWGGGLLEREEFYDLCDQNGILVMQELFQSSATGNNHPPRDAKYLDMILHATKSAVLQKRNHTCLISWCGGNELCFRGNYMDSAGNILLEEVEGNEGLTYDVSSHHWVPLDPEYPTLAAMRELVQQLDPTRMWFHTSGSGPITQNAGLQFCGGQMHDVHGPWEVLGPTEQYTIYNALDMMVHHEFGCQGSASVQTLETIIPPKYLWPLDENNPMVNYHGRMFAGVLNRVKVYFGELDDHRAYALTSRFLQWEQTRYALEAHRRLGERCACACLWHLGEPWPNIVENSMIDVYDQVKPEYYGHQKAFRPLHLSAHYDSVIHNSPFHVSFALCNATEAAFEGSVLAQLYALDGTLYGEYRCNCVAGADSVTSTAMEAIFSNLPEGVFFLRQKLLDLFGNVLDEGYSIHSTKQIPYRDLLLQPSCPIAATLAGNQITLKNNGSFVVSALTLECDNSGNAYFSDGCMMLLPGEVISISVEFINHKEVPLYLSGFGVPYQRFTTIQ